MEAMRRRSLCLAIPDAIKLGRLENPGFGREWWMEDFVGTVVVFEYFCGFLPCHFSYDFHYKLHDLWHFPPGILEKIRESFP